MAESNIVKMTPLDLFNQGGGGGSVSWDDVTDKPDFAAVSTSGSYNDLSDKPTIPAPVDVSGKADKSEMFVTPGTGADADKTTIQLKSGTSATVLTAHQDISGKANASEVNAALAQKADADALPYALVTPGEWTAKPPERNGAVVKIETGLDDSWHPEVYVDGDPVGGLGGDKGNAQSTHLEWTADDWGGGFAVVADRTLPGHLADRAVNVVPVSTTTMLTLPAEIPGRARDLVVDMTVTGSQAVSFVLPGGTAPTWVGAQPPSQFAAGRHVVSISELSGGFSYAEGVLDPSAFESVSNKVQSVSSSSTADEYPSAACVYALVGNVEAVLAAINGGVAP